MQVESNWKAAANLQLLVGSVHPPVRIEHDPVLPARRIGQKGRSADNAETDGLAQIDARNTTNFRTTSYCSLQDPNAPRVRRQLIEYYKEMLNRIPLEHYRAPVKEEERDGPEGSSGGVKNEPKGSDDEGEAVDDHAPGMAVKLEGGGAYATHNYRAVGILTQVHDPIGDQSLVPWEFFAIPNTDDDILYDGPIRAMFKTVPADRFPLLFAGTNASGADGGGGVDGSPQGRPRYVEEEGNNHQLGEDGQRLSLYPKFLNHFTGVFPGMAVGIVGDAFQRSARGTLTGVLLRDLVLPHRPMLPWHVDRPLGPGAASPAAAPQVTRVHFCSGPFPRRDVRALLRAVTRQALHRGADLLIIGGPLIKPFEDFEKEILPSLGAPFTEMLDGFVDALEETLEEYYATRLNVPHMKVVLVSHPDDVTQIPVLPTTMYAMSDTADVYFRSNPCRIAVNGVHFSVCNAEVVGKMRDVMVERWPTAEGSLRRVVETVVQSRWFTPIMELPMTTVDMKHMRSLRFDFCPTENELLELETKGSDGEETAQERRRQSTLLSRRNWDVAIGAGDEDALGNGAKEEADIGGGELKKAKHEPTATAEDEAPFVPEGGLAGRPPAQELPKPPVESMPHVVFLPSTRPRFAHVTHRGVSAQAVSDGVDGSTAFARRYPHVVDESPLDDTAQATGILVVNQEIWSRRSASKFELRVAEVTIPNSNLAAHRGATPANGVTCGVLHVFNADNNAL